MMTQYAILRGGGGGGVGGWGVGGGGWGVGGGGWGGGGGGGGGVTKSIKFSGFTAILGFAGIVS